MDIALIWIFSRPFKFFFFSRSIRIRIPSDRLMDLRWRFIFLLFRLRNSIRVLLGLILIDVILLLLLSPTIILRGLVVVITLLRVLLLIRLLLIRLLLVWLLLIRLLVIIIRLILLLLVLH